MQNLIQALKSVKGPDYTFDLNPKWSWTFPSVANFSWNNYRSPNPNIKVDIGHPVVGLRCRIPPRHLSQLKAMNVSCVGNFSWNIHRAPPKSKYQSWYLKPCCEVEVQNTTKALKWVKGPCNTFDIHSKWSRTLLSVGNLSWNINRTPHHQIKRSKLIFDILLRAWGAESHPGT